MPELAADRDHIGLGGDQRGGERPAASIGAFLPSRAFAKCTGRAFLSLCSSKPFGDLSSGRTRQGSGKRSDARERGGSLPPLAPAGSSSCAVAYGCFVQAEATGASAAATSASVTIRMMRRPFMTFSLRLIGSDFMAHTLRRRKSRVVRVGDTESVKPTTLHNAVGRPGEGGACGPGGDSSSKALALASGAQQGLARCRAASPRNPAALAGSVIPLHAGTFPLPTRS